MSTLAETIVRVGQRIEDITLMLVDRNTPAEVLPALRSDLATRQDQLVALADCLVSHEDDDE